MPEYTVRLTAEIDDEMTVELEEGATDDEIIEAANQDWSFTEASSWSSRIVGRPAGNRCRHALRGGESRCNGGAYDGCACGPYTAADLEAIG